MSVNIILVINLLLQEKIDSIHEQVIRGDMRAVQSLLDKKGWANARDHYGHSPLHKTVMANQEEIMKFLLHQHPEHIEDRDNVSLKILKKHSNEHFTIASITASGFK